MDVLLFRKQSSIKFYRRDIVEEQNVNNLHVPYIVYEGAMARMERTIKRLFILLGNSKEQ